MSDFLARLAEQKIREAIKDGELDNLPGQGKPLDLSSDSQIPADLRMAYKILKNSGLLPEEMDVQKEITSLETLIAACNDEEEKAGLKKKLSHKQLYLAILMEKRRSKR